MCDTTLAWSILFSELESRLAAVQPADPQQKVSEKACVNAFLLDALVPSIEPGCPAR